MKQSYFTTIMLLFSVVILGGFSSCNRTTEDPFVVPDLVFKATISGAESRTIDETLEENMVSTFTAGGSHNSASSLLLITATELQVYSLSFSVETPQLAEGTYTFDGTQTLTFASYNDIGAGASYTATSGTLTISKSELFQDLGTAVGAADDYFVEGSFDVTMADANNAANTITVSGTFSGLNIKSN